MNEIREKPIVFMSSRIPMTPSEKAEFKKFIRERHLYRDRWIADVIKSAMREAQK